jgi:hypothetical protein
MHPTPLSIVSVQRLTYLAAANERKAAHFELQQAIALGVLKAIGFATEPLAYDFGLFVW